MNVDKSKETEIYPYLPENIRSLLAFLPSRNRNDLNELRFTVDSPLIADVNGEKYYVGKNGFDLDFKNSYITTKNDLTIIMELITRSSVYAYNRHINDGFVTLDGANRVGICGNCAVNNGVIVSVKEINSIIFRISHEKNGVSSIIFNDIYSKGAINNTLIISPPGCGKTTYLRDIALSLNDLKKCGRIISCALIDERYELACAKNAKPCFNIGQNNFVISGYAKSLAIPMVVRSMAPDCIITDELCSKEDFEAILFASRSGCGVIASVHGFDEFNNEMKFNNISKIFKKCIVLSKRKGPGTIEKIVDVNFNA